MFFENLIDTLATVFLGLTTLVVGFLLGTYRDKDKTLFNKKIELYSKAIGELATAEKVTKEDLTELIHILAPVRLLAERRLEFEIRTLFTEAENHRNDKRNGKEINAEEVSKKLSASIKEIEQLMRRELKSKRLYSRKIIKPKN